MAAGDPTHCKPATTQRAVTLERFDGIRGAAWIITARGGKQRRERHLVAAHEQNEKSAHDGYYVGGAAVGDAGLEWRSTSARKPSTSAAYASRRARIARSIGGPVAKRREQLDAHELAKPALEAVAIDSRVAGDGAPRSRRAEMREGKRGPGHRGARSEFASPLE